MGFSISNFPRVPVLNGTAAAKGAYTAMKEGDLWYETDTKKTYTYDGAAWNEVLTGATSGASLTLIQHSALNAAASFDVSGISGYKFLLLFFNVTSDQAGATALNLKLNNDATAANYNFMSRAAAAVDQTNGALFQLTDGITTALCVGGFVVISVDGESTNNVHAVLANIGGAFVSKVMQNGEYRSASAITRVTLLGAAGNITGEVGLYGVKTA